jgi:hypothetical protein
VVPADKHGQNRRGLLLLVILGELSELLKFLWALKSFHIRFITQALEVSAADQYVNSLSILLFPLLQLIVDGLQLTV